MYQNLFTYNKVMFKIEMHSWWAVARMSPHLTRHIACVISVLMGGQPRGMQHNYSSGICAVCDAYETDDNIHIIFACPSSATKRNILWNVLLNSMPQGLVNSISTMNFKQKFKCLTSCFGGTYTPEWHTVYENVAVFIFNMYKERHDKYIEMGIT